MKLKDVFFCEKASQKQFWAWAETKKVFLGKLKQKKVTTFKYFGSSLYKQGSNTN